MIHRPFPLGISKAFMGLFALFALGGCNLVVMDPSGDIARQQSDLIIYSTLLMLIVILPVMVLTVYFAYKYRASNKKARYEPDWHHSTSLEIVIWSVPMAIILCLAGLTWVSTHRLEPYAPLKRISEEKPIDETVEPLVVQVTAMDWKWMFMYPEYGVASVNELAAPVDRPIEFRLTSTTVMNSFYIPALAGQIYAMSGMETELNAVMNEAGTYKGFSANYSGAGFSQMNFKFHGLSNDDFDDWINKVRRAPMKLDREEFLRLDKPTISHPVTHYNSVEDGLWDAILNRCVDTEKLCLHDMMVVDSMGGGGLEGIYLRNTFAGICTDDDPAGLFTRIREQNSRQAARSNESQVFDFMDRFSVSFEQSLKPTANQ